MNGDDFEEHLRRQPLRPVPGEWRDQILRTAAARDDRRTQASSPLVTSWWRELLWPSPQAWAGLAAVWLLIFLVNVSDVRSKTPSNSRIPAPSGEAALILQEQRRLMAELIGSPARLSDAVTTPDSRPRSQGKNEIRFI